MPTEITEMPSGKFAGQPLTELPSTYIVYSLENTNMVEALKRVLLIELHDRFFEDEFATCIISGS